MKSILLVDDDPHLRRSLEIGLRSLGYEVKAAGDAHEALLELSRHPIDIVITDVMMPGPSGLELARKIRAERPNLPVILMTGGNVEIYDGAGESREAAVPEVGPARAATSFNRIRDLRLIFKPFVLSELVNLFEVPAGA